MDVSESEAHHGRQRDRHILAAIGASLGGRLSTAVVALATVAIAARHLSQAELGLVFTTVTIWFFIIGSTDLGIGAVFTSRVAAAFGRDDHEDIRRQTKNALTLVGGIGFAVVTLGVVSTAVLPWAHWIGGGELSQPQVVAAMSVAFVAAGLSHIGAVGGCILTGIQRQVAAQVAAAGAAISALPGCAISAMVDAPVWAYVVSLVGLPALTSVLMTVWVLYVAHPEVRPHGGPPSATEVRRLVSSSGYLAMMRAGDALAAGTGTIVVATVQGPREAAVFGAAVRLYGLTTGLIQAATASVWPPIVEALARGHVTWATRRFRQSVLITILLCTIAGLGLAGLGPWFLSTWLGPSLRAPRELLALFGLLGLLSCVIGQLLVLLISVERLRTIGLVFLALAPVTVAGGVLLTRNVGSTGPVLAAVVAYLLVALPCMIFLVRATLAGIRNPLDPTGPTIEDGAG